jgi:hypothetical protein
LNSIFLGVVGLSPDLAQVYIDPIQLSKNSSVPHPMVIPQVADGLAMVEKITSMKLRFKELEFQPLSSINNAA